MRLQYSAFISLLLIFLFAAVANSQTSYATSCSSAASCPLTYTVTNPNSYVYIIRSGGDGGWSGGGSIPAGCSSVQVITITPSPGKYGATIDSWECVQGSGTYTVSAAATSSATGHSYFSLGAYVFGPGYKSTYVANFGNGGSGVVTLPSGYPAYLCSGASAGTAQASGGTISMIIGGSGTIDASTSYSAVLHQTGNICSVTSSSSTDDPIIFGVAASSSTTTTTTSSVSSTSSTSSSSTSTTSSSSTSTSTTIIVVGAGCALLPADLAVNLSLNAPWYCPINQQIYNEWVKYLPTVLVVLLLAFSLAALIFMIGIGLKSEKIRSFGMGELYEAVATTLIVGLFLYICAIIFGLIPSFVVGTINPYATAFNLMLKTVNATTNVYYSIFNTYSLAKVIITQSSEIEIMGFNPDIQGFINLATIPITVFYIDPSLVLATLLSDGIALLYAEYYLLVFFAAAAIPALLVPGIVFRSIFPTRALGGIMIALALGFYLVMPTLFSVAYYFTSPALQRDLQVAALQATRFGTAGNINGISAGSPLVLQLQSTQSAINNFWLLILFYPILIIATTYAFVQEVAGFIGGSVRFVGRLRSFV